MLELEALAGMVSIIAARIKTVTQISFHAIDTTWVLKYIIDDCVQLNYLILTDMNICPFQNPDYDDA